MASLSFHKNRDFMMMFFLANEETTLGRSSDNDICLPDTNISRNHLVIKRQKDGYVAIDRSTNGTYVNFKRIHTHILKENDEITIGSWRIIFSTISPEINEEQTHVANVHVTKILSYDSSNKQLKIERSYLNITTHGGRELQYEIKTFPCYIGKSKNNQVIIEEDDFISSRHCSIEFRNGFFYIKDLNSKNGTFFGTSKINEAQLAHGDIFTIGQTSISLQLRPKSLTIKPLSTTLFEGMIGRSKAMQEIFGLIQNIAATDANVLIEGDTGTGKELIAMAIHRLSGRNDRVFHPINCGAIAKDLIEGELFGHEKGAFTSAHQFRKGAFEYADGGTVFLDEIGELPLDLQPKLLRVLENMEIKRLGSNDSIKVNVRIISATNKNLEQEITQGRFRQDLYYRLFCIPITLPSLDKRIEDIPYLTSFFLKQGGKISESDDIEHPDSIIDRSMEHEALVKLTEYAWPGNIRELKNVINRAIVLCQGKKILAEHIVFKHGSMGETTKFERKKEADGPPPRSLRDVERETIRGALIFHKWNKSRAADSLGIAVSTLHEKIRKYDIVKD